MNWSWTELWLGLNCYFTELWPYWVIIWLNCHFTELWRFWIILDWTVTLTGQVHDWTTTLLGLYLTERLRDWTVTLLHCDFTELLLTELVVYYSLTLLLLYYPLTLRSRSYIGSFSTKFLWQYFTRIPHTVSLILVSENPPLLYLQDNAISRTQWWWNAVFLVCSHKL